MKNKELQEIYFRFLNLVRSVEELPSFPKLDATENELLNLVAQQWKKGERLLVSDAIAMRAIGSPATLHARLKQLRDKEMITYVIETDGRKKSTALDSKCSTFYYPYLLILIKGAHP